MPPSPAVTHADAEPLRDVAAAKVAWQLEEVTRKRLAIVALVLIIVLVTAFAVARARDVRSCSTVLSHLPPPVWRLPGADATGLRYSQCKSRYPWLYDKPSIKKKRMQGAAAE